MVSGVSKTIFWPSIKRSCRVWLLPSNFLFPIAMISLPTLTWLVPRGSSAPLWTWRWSPQWKWPRPRTAARIPAVRFTSDRHFQMNPQHFYDIDINENNINVLSGVAMHPRCPRALISVWSLMVSHASLRNLKFVNVTKKSLRHIYATNLTPHLPLALPWTWTIWARIFPASLLSLI